MGWNVVGPHQHHECELPNFEERKEAGIHFGSLVECDECGQVWKWDHMQNMSSVCVWKRVERCCSS